MSRLSLQLDARSRALRGLPAWVRVEAIGEAFPFSTPSEAQWLGAELLDLIVAGSAKSPVAWLGPLARPARTLRARWRPSDAQTAARARRLVADHWERLPPMLRSAASALGGWSEFAALMIQDESPVVRAAAAAFVVQAVEPASWTLIAPLLNDADSRVATAAEGVLTDLVRRVCPEPALDDGEQRGLAASHAPMACSALDVERVVLAALQTLANPERRATLAALLALATPQRVRANSELATWLAVGDSAAHAAMKGFLRWTRLPLARRRAAEWLSMPSFANAAIDRLSRASSIADYEAVLAHSHLLLNPARAARLGSLGVVRPGQLHRPQTESDDGPPWPAASMLAGLSVEARRGLPRFLDSTKPPPAARDELFAAAINEPDTRARHASVRVVPQRAVLEFALDADAGIARCAALRASGIGDEVLPSASDERLWTKLRRSPHAAVRDIAALECERFAMFDPTTTRGMLRLRRRLAVDRGAVIAMLRERLDVAPAAAKPVVVAAIRRLGLQRELLVELTRTLSASDTRAAATAAAALGELPVGAITDDAPLRASLEHADPRVRANAAGAMLKHAPRDESLIELKNDPHHRVRSTALRELFAARVNAFGSLHDMLHDRRPEHRLAAAWLGARAPVVTLPMSQQRELIQTMQSLAQGDEDPRVRRRASGALCVLVGQPEEVA